MKIKNKYFIYYENIYVYKRVDVHDKMICGSNMEWPANSIRTTKTLLLRVIFDKINDHKEYYEVKCRAARESEVERCVSWSLHRVNKRKRRI